MAYAVKYLFKFQSSNGIVREIRVLQDGYSGDAIQRPLGRAPVIKKGQNGGVHGTSLTFYAECHIDREYIEFYTSDPKEYRVDVYAGSTLLWQGYITPELYSEPDIAPPYDVQVVATDGVGELKLYDFAPQGTVTLRALLTYLLGYTGLTTDVNLVSSLKPGSRGAGALLDMQICVDYLAGKTCYEALTYILTTLHATITRWGGAWVLVRETNVTFTGDKVRYFNTSGNSALLTGSVQTLGAMRSAPAWPVGQLSTVIDPAKNKVVVQAPWHPVTGLTNPDMTSDTGWSKSNGATYSSGGYLLPNVGSSAAAFISQTLSMAGLRTPTSFELRVTGVSAELGTRSGAVIGVLITYTVGSTVYLLRKGDEGTPVWQQGADPGPSIDGRVVDYQQPIASFDADRIQAETLSIEDIPAFVQGTSYPSGTLKIYIVGVCARVYGAHLDVVLPKGYQDILRIDNGARGEGDSVEIAIGRVTSEVAYYQSFLQGLLLDTGSIITSFSDANFTTAMDYLALISRDYALSAALPRALAKGTVYLESSIGMPPLVFAKGGLNYWLETWSWDLYEDELEIDARTLPSASLTVQSETILESDGSTVSSSSTGSSGGGGGAIPGGGVQYFEPHNDGIILKADYEYVSVPDVLLGDDEESLNALLAVIAGNAVQGAAAYGYFSDGVLPYNHGGTGFSTYTKGDLLYASANDTLSKLAANSTGTKKFLTMTSSVPSWGGIAFGDLPTLYWANVAVSSSSSTTTEPTVKSITIGGATLTWVAPVGTTPGYLKINSALLTDGDQIVGGGTPGGGGGGGASYLSDLLDVKYGLNPSADDLLIYSSSVPLNPDGTITGPGWTTIAKSSVGRIYTGGTGITIGNDNTISVTANTYAPYNSAGYLPLSAGSDYPLTGALTIKTSTWGGQLDIFRNTSAGDAFIKFRNSGDGLLGFLGISGSSSNKIPAYTTDGAVLYELLHAGNYSSYALPLSAGSSYPITGPLYMNNRLYMRGGNFIEFDASDNSFRALFAADSNNDPIWYKGSTWYTMLTTNNYSSYALPLSAGSSYPLTNDLYITAGKGIEATSGAGLLVYHPSDWTGISSTQWGVGASDSQGVIRSNNNNLLHYRNGTTYDIWDKYNAGTSTTAWTCSTLTTNGSVTMYESSSHTYRWTLNFNGAVGRLYAINDAGTAYNDILINNTITVTSDYNVGISNPSPSYKLDVAGTIGLSDGSLIMLGKGTNAIYLTQTSINWHNTSNTWASSLIGFESANIKIQQTTTHSGGHIYLTGAVTNSSTTNTTQIVFGTSSSNHVAISSNTDAVIINPTTSTTTGQIILGVNSTTSSFGNSVTFKGADNRFESATWNNVKIKRTSTGGAWICFYPSNQETYYWDIGANGTSPYNFAFEYQGNGVKAYLTPTGTFSTVGDQVVSSDINLKTNLQPVTYSVADIAKTRAVTFDWKDGRGHSAGSIAQDWKPLIPELVHGEEGNMTLAYGQIALVNTIIEAREIDVLKKRVAELEAEVQRLRMN